MTFRYFWYLFLRLKSPNEYFRNAYIFYMWTYNLCFCRISSCFKLAGKIYVNIYIQSGHSLWAIFWCHELDNIYAIGHRRHKRDKWYHFLKAYTLNLSHVSIKKNIVLILLDRPSAWFDHICWIKDVRFFWETHAQ